MPRLNPVEKNQAPEKSKPLLDQVESKYGMVPNIIATMAHSPAALKAYLSFGEAMGEANLPATLREQLAITIAGENGCGYCASAHTAIGKNLGVEEDELTKAKRGEASDPKAQAALDFAKSIIRNRGWVDDSDLKEVRDAGYSDADVTEIIATVAINTFTNYFNHVAGTDIDFPEVKVGEPVAG